MSEAEQTSRPSREQARHMLREAARIFIAYAHSDLKKAREIRQKIIALRRDKTKESVFLDQEHLSPGTDTGEEKYTEPLLRSDLFVVLCGKTTRHSETVNREISLAHAQRDAGRCAILPVILAHGYALPEALHNRIQGIFLRHLFPAFFWVPVALVSAALLGLLAAGTLYGLSELQKRRQLVRSHIAQGQDLFERRPAEARLHFARAVEIAEKTSLAKLWSGRDASYARSWLGISWPGQTPAFFWHHRDLMVRGATFSPSGEHIVTAVFDLNAGFESGVESRDAAQVWHLRTGEPQGERMPHNGWLQHAEFSPDGKLVVTASQDNTARIWDAVTGESQQDGLLHPASVNFATFSPDGRTVLTAGDDGVARFWEVATGRQLPLEFKHERTILRAVFNHDGTRIATASQDNTAQVWEAKTGVKVGRPLQHKDFVQSALFSPDGSRLVTASSDGTAVVWDIEADTAVGKPMIHRGSVQIARFSPDGTRVVTASEDDTARIWDAVTGQSLSDPLAHGADVLSASFDPSGSYVVTASFDNTAKVWSAEGRLLRTLPHAGWVTSARFSADATGVLTASYDHTARFWPLRWPIRVSHPGNTDKRILHVAFSPNGAMVATASKDGTARIWDAGTGREMSPSAAYQDSMDFVQFSTDNSRLLTANSDGTAGVWNVSNGQQIGETMRHGRYAKAAFSHNGEFVVTAGYVDAKLESDESVALIWNATPARPLTPPLEHPQSIRHVAFAPDDQTVLTLSGATARIWDVSSGTLVGNPMQHSKTINDADFSPDGQHVATASDDGTVKLWCARTGDRVGEPLTWPDPLSYLSHVRFSPDGERLLTNSEGKVVQLWNTVSREQVGRTISHGNEIKINYAIFSPDGKAVATAGEDGSMDGSIRIWDAITGEALAAPLLHGSPANHLAYDEAGSHIVAGYDDGTARVWDVAPTADSPNVIRLRAEVATALTLDSGEARPLTEDEWRERKAQLSVLQAH